MSSAMDLDASLDDIIKKKKHHNKSKGQQQYHHKNNNNNNTDYAKHKHNKYNNNNSNNNSRLPQNRAPAGKSSIINRLGKNGVQVQLKSRNKSGQHNIFSKALSTIVSKQKGTDPSDIVITKQVSPSEKRNLHSKANTSTKNKHQSLFSSNRYREETILSESRPIRHESTFNIRGVSNTNHNSFSIRGESGPTSVIISNLDRHANVADVTTACSQFGEVIGCEVFTDRSGRSIGEAEVEFSTKSAAFECISKLDNETADGRVLRVILREKPVMPPTQIRSAISSNSRSFPSSGKLYADQMSETTRFGTLRR
ncbi:unnamed protein product [Cunninghamella blakesleeana]